MLGYGSRDCFTPSEAIICDFALWPSQLFEAPHLYILSLFTSIWFHNDPNHFLLILVVILLFFQTAEVRIGTRRALVALFGVQFLVAILMTLTCMLEPNCTQMTLGTYTDIRVEITWVVQSACSA